MPIVAGIDEAGYGPLLGPLAASAVAFRVPEEALEADLWERFAAAVCQGAPRGSDRLRVADSKVVHRSPDGLGALERNLMPFLGLLGPLPAGLRALLAALNCANLGCMDGYPWYCGCDLPLPQRAAAAELARCSRALGERLQAAGGAFVGARLELLDAAEFNREVKSAGNKSVALARRVAALMGALWRARGEERVLLLVDKQGGRNAYRGFLRAVFPAARIAAIEEGARRSCYEITEGARAMQVRFEPRADSAYLPVALASMLSKYARELCMALFNDYWRARVPGLQPTAGYYEDGRRFLAEIETARQAEGIARDRIERSR